MGVDRLAQLAGGYRVAHGQRDGVDQLLGIHAQYGGAKNQIGVGADDELHHARRFPDDSGPRHPDDLRDGLGSDQNSVPLLDCLPLGEPDGPQRRGHEHGLRHRNSVSDGPSPIAYKLVCDDPAVVERYVGELWAAVDVADRKHVRLAAPQVLVHEDGTVRVGRNARRLQTQFTGCGAAPGGGQDQVDFELMPARAFP